MSVSCICDYCGEQIDRGERFATIDVRGAVAVLLAFLVLEAIAEAYVPFVKNYGPIGALNAFSDPSHRHQLSLRAGAAVTFAWAVFALVAPTVVNEGASPGRRRRELTSLSPHVGPLASCHVRQGPHEAG